MDYTILTPAEFFKAFRFAKAEERGAIVAEFWRRVGSGSKEFAFKPQAFVWAEQYHHYGI